MVVDVEGRSAWSSLLDDGASHHCHVSPVLIGPIWEHQGGYKDEPSYASHSLGEIPVGKKNLCCGIKLMSFCPSLAIVRFIVTARRKLSKCTSQALCSALSTCHIIPSSQDEISLSLRCYHSPHLMIASGGFWSLRIEPTNSGLAQWKPVLSLNC
jgi:hypothetical protein